MTTLLDRQIDAGQMTMLTPGNLAISPASYSQGSAGMDSKLLQLTSVLQTTLELDDLLDEFGSALAGELRFDSLHFINEEHDLRYASGRKARHSCSYQITVNKLKLGSLTLTRTKKFTRPELETIERLLCALPYPLRNAIKYQQALLAAFMDPLTGAENRAAMDAAVRREIEVARRHKRHLALIVLDIDHFKRINDCYGHTAGDSVLRLLADCAQRSIRCADRLFRFGGEEFVVLLPDTEAAGARRLAERIRRHVASLKVELNEQAIKLTVSAGISTLLDADDARSFFMRADEALYEAKAAGRNQVCHAE